MSNQVYSDNFPPPTPVPVQLFNVLQSSLFNFSHFCFVCLFVFYSDTPTSLSSSGPGKFTVETEQALFWPTGVILTFCSLSSFSHIFLLLLVLCPVLRCDKTFFQAILDSEDHRWHFVNRHFGNFFFSPILIFNCDEQFFL